MTHPAASLGLESWESDRDVLRFALDGSYDNPGRARAQQVSAVGGASVTVCRPTGSIIAMWSAQRSLIWGDLYPPAGIGDATRSNEAGSKEARNVCNILP